MVRTNQFQTVSTWIYSAVAVIKSAGRFYNEEINGCFTEKHLTAII
jgi:hypothetical protein